MVFFDSKAAEKALLKTRWEVLNAELDRLHRELSAYIINGDESEDDAAIICYNKLLEAIANLHKQFDNEERKKYELTPEALLDSGFCPCGRDSSEGCAVAGCALHLHEIKKEGK